MLKDNLVNITLKRKKKTHLRLILESNINQLHIAMGVNIFNVQTVTSYKDIYEIILIRYINTLSNFLFEVNKKVCYNTTFLSE